LNAEVRCRVTAFVRPLSPTAPETVWSIVGSAAEPAQFASAFQKPQPPVDWRV
jgi:hypothetical protein